MAEVPTIGCIARWTTTQSSGEAGEEQILGAGDYLRFGAYLEPSNNGEFTKDEYGSSDDLNRAVFERVR